MRELRVETEIDAPPDAVWRVLSDVSRWGEWNPLIPRFVGELEVGNPIRFDLMLRGRRMPIRARLIRVDPERELCWRGPGSMLLGLLFSGEHWFAMRRTANGTTRFIHGERFTGALVAPLWSRLGSELQPAYAEMNLALKNRVLLFPA